MKNYTFRLTDTLLDDLQEHADHKGATVSDFIRDALTDALTGNAKTQAEAKQHEATRKQSEQNTEAVLSELAGAHKKIDALIATFAGYLKHQAANQ